MWFRTARRELVGYSASSFSPTVKAWSGYRRLFQQVRCREIVREIKNKSKSVIRLVQPNAVKVATHTPASSSKGNTTGESEHFVQFYETDSFLLNSLTDFVGTGLRAGNGVVVLGAKGRRQGLDESLRQSGLDPSALRASGQYLPLDAAKTLSQFMIGELPDRALFTEVVGSIIERAGRGGRELRAFGEMVALLWEAGNYEGAIRLEELWNDLQKTHSFSLFCAYPMKQSDGRARVKPFTDVCAAHARIIPAESYMALTNQDDRASEIVELQRRSKSLEAEVKERQRTEKRLRISLRAEQVARAEAESASRMKDEFLGTVSHELRTPLNAIIGWSHMLLAGKLDEATAVRALEIIDRSAKAQAQLIEDILDVSRVITGKVRLDTVPVDVAAVINLAVESAQLAADSKGIQLEVILDPLARHIVGDFSRLQQVVWNLIGNAIKFTPSGGRVAVRLSRLDRSIEICVSDTGEGINPAFLPFVFDRFRQADGSQTRLHGGVGLGLAIVRHLVELHGGTVLAESPGLGRGATFTITLPIAPARRMRRNSTRDLGKGKGMELGSRPQLDGLQVLLVDDDRDTLQVLTALLTESRAEVQTASSAAEALEVLQRYKPDVMVFDLAMPYEDGYSLIRKVRASETRGGRQTPAVALTARVRVEDRAQTLAAGFNLFVPKPVEPSELITAIANVAGLVSLNS
jgi:signal transduction histidine kinase/ActR/RegA family two-component response regulator